jgi:DNA ligase-1
MKQFVQLFRQLDQTNSTRAKLDALENYFKAACNEDILWAYALMAGKMPKRSIKTSMLRTWAAEHAGIPLWLFEESYHTVGDLAETISLLVHAAETANTADQQLYRWIEGILSLSLADDLTKKHHVTEAWNRLDRIGCFIFNKLITGGFRMGVSQKLAEKALARVLNKDADELAHILMGNWNPATTDLKELLQQNQGTAHRSRPYPFCLAHALIDEPEALGTPSAWIAEWKWDGIRAQLIVREGECYIWSRGEELISDKFPEITALIPYFQSDCVLDGELVIRRNGQIQSFQELQTRIGRKNVSRKVLSERPAAFIAYDLFELNGIDLRNKPLQYRKEQLEKILVQLSAPSEQIQHSPGIEFSSWEELKEIRQKSREMQSEGLMLKRKDSHYHVGRKRGDWWKWKVDPFTIDAVLIYAMQGHGRRANLYTDYTFAVWQDGRLQPFAKAYSGLTDEEILAVDKFVKANTIEKFGPVRSVKPELVFELAFEGIQKSTRHKSGIAVRFPRISRWRKDKKAEEADTFDALKNLIK